MQIPLLLVLSVLLDAIVLAGLQAMTAAATDPRRLRRAIFIALGLAIANTGIFAGTRLWLEEGGVTVAFPTLILVNGAVLHYVGKLTRRQTMIALGILLCYWIMREFAALHFIS